MNFTCSLLRIEQGVDGHTGKLDFSYRDHETDEFRLFGAGVKVRHLPEDPDTGLTRIINAEKIIPLSCHS